MSSDACQQLERLDVVKDSIKKFTSTQSATNAVLRYFELKAIKKAATPSLKKLKLCLTKVAKEMEEKQSAMLAGQLDRNDELSELSSIASESDSQSDSDSDEVSDIEIAQLQESPTGFCPFCHTFQTKLQRHLRRKHSTEEQVSATLTNCDNEKKRLLMQSLREKGRREYNSKHGKKKLPVYRFKDGRMRKMQTFPCAYCSKRVASKQLPRHIENCADRLLKEAGASKLKGTRSYKRAGRYQDLEHIENTNVRKVLSTFAADKVATLAEKDPYLFLFLTFLCNKYVLRNHITTIRQKIRTLARFLLFARQNSNFVFIRDLLESQFFCCYEAAGIIR